MHATRVEFLTRRLTTRKFDQVARMFCSFRAAARARRYRQRRFRFYRWKLTVIAGRSIFLARKTVLREIFCNIGEVDNYSRNCTKIQKKRSVLLFCVFCNASRGGEIFPKIRKKFTLQNFARIASSNRQSSSH